MSVLSTSIIVLFLNSFLDVYQTMCQRLLVSNFDVVRPGSLEEDLQRVLKLKGHGYYDQSRRHHRRLWMCREVPLFYLERLVQLSICNPKLRLRLKLTHIFLSGSASFHFCFIAGFWAGPLSLAFLLESVSLQI